MGGSTSLGSRGRGPLLQLMGDWSTLAVAVVYATPKHAIHHLYHPRHRRPVPVRKEGGFEVAYGSLSRWAGWIQREVRERGSWKLRTAALGVIPMVLQSLSSMAKRGSEEEEEEEEDAYYSDEERPEEDYVSVAAKGLGACGEAELSKRLWDKVVPRALLSKYRQWLRGSRGAGESSRIRLREMLQSLVMEGCLLTGEGVCGFW